MKKKCAYCNKQNVKITKEHLVNKTFIDKYYKIGVGYSSAYDKYTENYLTVKDVCAKCNNEQLSILDTYFLEFYEANLPKGFVDSSTTINIVYDYNKLSRWILKTLYNTERKSRSYPFLPKYLFKLMLSGLSFRRNLQQKPVSKLLYNSLPDSIKWKDY